MNRLQHSALFLPCSFLSTESNKTGSWRFLRPRYDEKTSPCSSGCPAGEDIAAIQMLAARGLFKEAWETILRENPLPAVCGRVCFHPCETVCNRGDMDAPVAVHTIERFLADTAARYGLRPEVELLPARPERIAVIGSGPSGLSAAWFLAILGYSCDVQEAAGEPGGILRWGIPQYRLPAAVLKKEIERISGEATGGRIRIETCRTAEADFLKGVRGRYDAIFIGAGHGRTTSLGIPGEDLEGVQDGLRFLEEIRRGGMQACDGLSAVIGGGNTAIDVARSIRRLGGDAVVLYRRRRQDMPAFAEEIAMALDEGVELRELLAPVEIKNSGGRFVLTLNKMKVAGEEKGRATVEPDGGRTIDFQAHRVFKATGAEPAGEWLNPPANGRGVLKLDNCVLVSSRGNPVAVFGGDLANGKKSVAHAVASGKAAAMALDTLFRKGLRAVRPALKRCEVGPGPALSMDIYLGHGRETRNRHVVSCGEINTDYFRFAPRIIQPRLLKSERIQSFEEIEMKIAANLAMREADRCFNCGTCNQCDNCYLFCPDMAVIRERDGEGRRINYDYCKGCGLCVVECPRNAMALEEEGA